MKILVCVEGRDGTRNRVRIGFELTLTAKMASGRTLFVDLVPTVL